MILIYLNDFFPQFFWRRCSRLRLRTWSERADRVECVSNEVLYTHTGVLMGLLQSQIYPKTYFYCFEGKFKYFQTRVLLLYVLVFKWLILLESFVIVPVCCLKGELWLDCNCCSFILSTWQYNKKIQTETFLFKTKVHFVDQKSHKFCVFGFNKNKFTF